MEKMKSLLFRGGSVLLPQGLQECDIFVENGKIAKVEKNITDKSDTVVNVGGFIVSPGFVDLHCHLREPGFEHKEDIESGTAAAAAGGFTDICCMANTNPVNDSSVVTQFILKRAAERGKAHVYPIAAVTKGLQGEKLTEVGELIAAGAVALSDDGMSVRDGGQMRLAMSYAGQFDMTVISHPEDLTLSGDGVMNEGYWSTALGLPGITRAAEETIIARDCMLAGLEKTHLHIAHISTAGGVELVRYFKKLGYPITCEVTPHHLYATDDWLKNYDTNAKVSPPLRTEKDRLALIAGLQDGTIDCIATDHAPHHADEKRIEFALAACGISGFETAFALCWTALVATKEMTPEDLLHKMTSAPARVLGLDAGEIAVGKSASLVVLDPKKNWTVNPEKFVSRGKNSPFGGEKLTGAVLMTFLDGKLVYKNEA